MRRIALVAAALTLAGAACTGTTAPTTTATATTTSSTTTTSAPSSTTAPAPTPVAPPVPDPFEIADRALPDLEGYRWVTTAASDAWADRLGDRLDPVFDALFAAMTFDGLETPDGVEVFVASLYPLTPYRGDPTLAPATVEAIVDFATDAEPLDAGGITLWQVADPEGGTWLAWGGDTHTVVAAADNEATDAAAAALRALAEASGPSYRWRAGDCLYFPDPSGDTPYAPYGDAEVVPCDGGHTHEVIWSEEVEAGDGAGFPGDDLAIRRDLTCGDAYDAYVGLAPGESSIGLIAYSPDELEWVEGDRYLACVITLVSRDGTSELVAGRLAEAGPDHLLTRQEGDCLRSSLLAPPIPCEVPHVAQFLGEAIVQGAADDPFPGYDDVARSGDRVCRVVLEGFAWKLEADGAEVAVFPIGPDPWAWARGDRTVDCYAFAATPDGAALVEGGFDQDWRIVGVSDDAISA